MEAKTILARETAPGFASEDMFVNNSIAATLGKNAVATLVTYLNDFVSLSEDSLQESTAACM